MKWLLYCGLFLWIIAGEFVAIALGFYLQPAHPYLGASMIIYGFGFLITDN